MSEKSASCEAQIRRVCASGSAGCGGGGARPLADTVAGRGRADLRSERRARARVRGAKRASERRKKRHRDLVLPPLLVHAETHSQSQSASRVLLAQPSSLARAHHPARPLYSTAPSRTSRPSRSTSPRSSGPSPGRRSPSRRKVAHTQHLHHHHHPAALFAPPARFFVPVAGEDPSSARPARTKRLTVRRSLALSLWALWTSRRVQC